MNDIELQVKQFILETFLFESDLNALQDDESFIGSRILDSLGILHLITWTEETCGIAVGDNEVLPENFDSVQKVADYVRLKLNIPAAMAA
jgi:acyl carrier protein